MKDVRGWAFPDADEFMVNELGPDGCYQSAQLEAALRRVTDFGCAVDGGAHVGTWSRVMATKFARVVAFEPCPDTFACLTENMEWTASVNVDCHRSALGVTSDWVEMTLDAENAIRKNTGARHVQVGGGSVPVIALDSLGLEHVGLIKLDVEGSEPWAIDGAVKTIKRCKPIILFENKWLWARYFGLPKDAVAARLKALHYVPLEQVSRDAIWGPK